MAQAQSPSKKIKRSGHKQVFGNVLCTSTSFKPMCWWAVSWQLSEAYRKTSIDMELMSLWWVYPWDLHDYLDCTFGDSLEYHHMSVSFVKFSQNFSCALAVCFQNSLGTNCAPQKCHKSTDQKLKTHVKLIGQWVLDEFLMRFWPSKWKISWETHGPWVFHEFLMSLGVWSGNVMRSWWLHECLLGTWVIFAVSLAKNHFHAET